MVNINESNSIFTELNPEDAASINGGTIKSDAYIKVSEMDEPNHYLVTRFKKNGNELWNIVVDNKGTIKNIKDDETEILQPFPSYFKRAERQAIMAVREYLCS